MLAVAITLLVKNTYDTLIQGVSQCECSGGFCPSLNYGKTSGEFKALAIDKR
jgi:hypothetical protein